MFLCDILLPYFHLHLAVERKSSFFGLFALFAHFVQFASSLVFKPVLQKSRGSLVKKKFFLRGEVMKSMFVNVGQCRSMSSPCFFPQKAAFLYFANFPMHAF